jgi:predicted Fe-Mo cluster-binding NifX family protein
MKVAIPLWQGRVSPVFDEASRLLIVDILDGSEKCRKEESLLTHNPFERAQVFPKLGIELLICGMISRKQQAALDSAGIRIIPHICGSMEEVITAFLEGRLENGALLMPGCGRRKRTRNQRDGINEELKRESEA